MLCCLVAFRDNCKCELHFEHFIIWNTFYLLINVIKRSEQASLVALSKCSHASVNPNLLPETQTSHWFYQSF